LEFFFNGTRVLLSFEVEGKYGGSKGGKGGPLDKGNLMGHLIKTRTSLSEGIILRNLCPNLIGLER
jgi:hypothetical protein